MEEIETNNQIKKHSIQNVLNSLKDVTKLDVKSYKATGDGLIIKYKNGDSVTIQSTGIDKNSKKEVNHFTYRDKKNKILAIGIQ